MTAGPSGSYTGGLQLPYVFNGKHNIVEQKYKYQYVSTRTTS